MSKTAIIIGATGVTGTQLVQLLLRDNRYKTVVLLSRRSMGISHPKIKEHLIDLFDLENHGNLFNADEVYCCIGTTKAKTPNQDLYRSIDFGIPVRAAKLCQQYHIDSFAVISSLGADSNSRIFYSRLKGEMEDAILDLKLPNTVIVRPSLIAGERDEKRFGESFAKGFMKLFNPFMIGPLKVYRSIYPLEIAKAMIWLVNHPSEQRVFLSNDLKRIAKYGH